MQSSRETSGIDPAKPPREGEELPREKLTDWICDHLPSIARPLTILQFAKGHSNLTYLVTDSSGRELVLRRPPRGSKVKSAHDMNREVRMLNALGQSSFQLAPKPLAQCDDESIIGAPFYLMERLRGTILRGPNLPQPLDAKAKRDIDEALVDTLAKLHSLEVKSGPLADLGKPEGYVERQVSGWTKRYLDAKTDEIPEIEEAAKILAARMPKESDAALIHNDYKFDNVVLDPKHLTIVIGLLDWEMSTLGDPLMDLGTALAYWVESTDREELRAFAFGPTFAPGSLTRRDFAQRYALQSGKELGDLSFYLAFALFKNAVVAQQIYARFKKGLTQDERFAHLNFAVKILGEEAMRILIDKHAL